MYWIYELLRSTNINNQMNYSAMTVAYVYKHLRPPLKRQDDDGFERLPENRNQVPIQTENL